MTSRRDLNQELFGQERFGHPTASPPAASRDATREVSLSELAELSELTEEQAKVRVKVTHLATCVEALSDGLEHSDHRFEKLRTALRGAVSQVERLSSADDLHSRQMGELGDSLRGIESQLEAQRNALAFLRNSDGQQQQSIERLKQSRLTLMHILLFGILLCAGSVIALDVNKAFSFHHRLSALEQRFYP
jgi:small-conductance mechanosensitive channel